MKNDFRILLVSTVLGLTTIGFAQDPARRTPEPPAVEAQQPATAEQCIEQLGSESYRERLDAEQKLRQLGKAAVPALERAARQSDDGEVQWRARRLLRQIGRGTGPDAEARGLVERRRANDQEPEALEPGVQEPRAPRRWGRNPWRQGGVEGMREQFNRLFRDFERDFGVDIPRHRFFEDGFFRDLEAQLKMVPDGAGSSQGMSVQIGPDGVHVEVTETGKDGKTEKKVYDAPDLDTFKKLYPDVLEDNGLGMGLSPFGRGLPGLRRGIVRPLERGFDWPVAPRVVPFGPGAADAPSPAGRRLGVLIRELSDALRDYLELDADTGLMVESVQQGTLAEALGLQENDIVTHINKQKIGSPADVQRALGALDKGEKVTVDFVRKGRRQTAETTKKESGAERAPLEKRSESKPGSGR